tara:strand:- start:816 stop:1307 length:492 start_codon:yes stop_codon:yes gene_type:complete
MNNIFSWLTIIASGVSAVAAWAMWRVSKNLYALQKSIEESKKPIVHFWCDNNNLLTLANIGKEPLPIRTIRVLKGLRSTTQDISYFTLSNLKKGQVAILSENYSQVSVNCIIEPNQLYQIMIKEELLQLTIEVMYYDNSFEFLEIDTSILGGKYILTGKGKKY